MFFFSRAFYLNTEQTERALKILKSREEREKIYNSLLLNNKHYYRLSSSAIFYLILELLVVINKIFENRKTEHSSIAHIYLYIIVNIFFFLIIHI